MKKPRDNVLTTIQIIHKKRANRFFLQSLLALLMLYFGSIIMRGNQGIALIQAFQSGQVEKAYETALGSDGSAMAEQEKWLDSLEAKTQQFKASWQELSNAVIDSEFMKGLIDLGTAALSVLSNIIDNIGVLNTALIGFAGYKAIKSIS